MTYVYVRKRNMTVSVWVHKGCMLTMSSPFFIWPTLFGSTRCRPCPLSVYDCDANLFSCVSAVIVAGRYRYSLLLLLLWVPINCYLRRRIFRSHCSFIIIIYIYRCMHIQLIKVLKNWYFLRCYSIFDWVFLIFYVHWKFACVLCMETDNFSKCNLPFSEWLSGCQLSSV